MDPKNPFIRQDKKIQNRDIRGRISSLILTVGEENLIISLNNG